jgi:hypothetical protein
MLANVTHLIPLTTIRRDRLLPAPGKVVVRKGQKVSATDTVAEAKLAPAHLLMDVARGLGLPARKADKRLQVRAGDKVSAGDVLAGPVGIARRVVRAPQDSVIILAGDGQVLLEVQTQPYELKAGIPGTVIELIEGRGVTIETTGALLQGDWGSGGIDFGVMNVLAKDPEHVLTPDQLDVSMRGSVIMAGYVESADVLKMAGDLPLRALILACMAPSLVPLVHKLALPVILLEGLGQRPLNPAAFRLLSTNDRREVAVNAEAWDPYTGSRPEVVIPLPASGTLPLPAQGLELAVDQTVRIVSAPYLGQLGKIVALRGIAALPNGVRAPAVEVRLENGEVVLAPAANVEVLQ